jgi:hypothetical protein
MSALQKTKSSFCLLCSKLMGRLNVRMADLMDKMNSIIKVGGWMALWAKLDNIQYPNEGR